MTALELTRRAIMLLAAGQPSPSFWLEHEAEISSLIPNAMEEVANKIANDPHKKALLMQNYTVTLSSGDGSILASNGSITSAADVLFWSIPNGEVLDTATNKRLVFIPNKSEFEGYVYPGLYYYTLANQRVYTRSGQSGNYHDSDKYDVTGPLTVTANFIPSVTTLPEILEDDAVSTLARLAAIKFELEKKGD